MGSLSDTLIAGAGMPNLSAVHEEPVTILDGVDAGKTMFAIINHEEDSSISSETIDSDPREKTMARFTIRPGNIPSANTKKLVLMRTSDGKKWKATKQDFSAYLSTDFQLVQTI
jgi:hypothetical protein